jgi:hypothetical protein
LPSEDSIRDELAYADEFIEPNGGNLLRLDGLELSWATCPEMADIVAKVCNWEGAA